MSTEGATTRARENGDQYNVFRPWEARERERDLYPHPISVVTLALLMNVGLLKYYQEATSLKVHSILFLHLIHQWSVQEQVFHVDPNMWYRPFQEDIYFINGLSRRGEDFPEFPDFLLGFAAESQPVYS